ncbi:SRPBCC family protein [Glutamicibacter mishrai]|uniref:SRPBCC family protein n=1 Tax=Glutamicibacter mishrai TaxID=1775880 RepID=UPI001FED0E35|nr:SRPBCC domain-containing protein [Glutamicibacter mishrai]
MTRIEVEQFFPHPPAKLWKALTTPEIMEQCLMPNNFEPRVWHKFNFQTQPIEQTNFSGLIDCAVLELEPEKLLTISWADADSSNAMATTVSWTFQPEGNGTRLFLVHAGFDLDDPHQAMARNIMNGGWRRHVLRRFGELLDELS